MTYDEKLKAGTITAEEWWEGLHPEDQDSFGTARDVNVLVGESFWTQSKSCKIAIYTELAANAVYVSQSFR